ncbi:UNVERIFIED_CONTAM: hypothetical protein Slati_4508100 [Sesamum latifolium]|uniref:Reverse transcriptase Ty1/copia-type domain-containing protein n=1 Tax=Sesamum latifolium TaxID=2727402 RepID=A0AAW2STK9_9LAMI
MKNSKRGFLPMRYGVKLFKTRFPNTDEENKTMCDIPYAPTIGSIQYVVQCTRPDIAFAPSITSRVPSKIPQLIPPESEYIAASEVAKEAVWMKNYIQELGVVPSIVEPIIVSCDNNGAIAQLKEPRSHQKFKHILRRYHLLREMVGRGDVRMDLSHQQKIHQIC